MFKTPLIACVGAVVAAALFAAPVAAQTTATPNSGTTEETNRASGTVTGERVLPGRIAGQEDGNNRRENRNQRGRQTAPTPEQNRLAAQALADTLATGCQVTEATLLGFRAEGEGVYEAVCATGPGFILSNTTPPSASDCIGLAGAGYVARETDPAAEVGIQCVAPANQNAMVVVSDYARRAGVTCEIDQVLAFLVGRYEIGCANEDGYWVAKEGDSWKAEPCWDVIISGNRCRFSTPEESKAGWTRVLAGTEAAACAVEQARSVGIDAQRLVVYEVKCAAGDGYLVRVENFLTAKRTHACSDPNTFAIARGCQLTPQAGVPETPAAE